jgi:hypothetical protein
MLARSICGIRWTPDAKHVCSSAYYAWMLEGLALFHALAAHDVEVIEVFPTASWTRWHGRRGHRTRAVWTRYGPAAPGALTETMGDIVVPIGPLVTPKSPAHLQEMPGLAEGCAAPMRVVMQSSDPYA